MMINLLDVVRLEGVEPCPANAQQENVFYQEMSLTGKHYEASEQILQRFMDESHRHVFYNYGKAILPYDYEQGSHSILLLRVEHAEVNADTGYSGQIRYRIRFLYHGHQYDFPITDPYYQTELKQGKRATGQKGTIYITFRVENEELYSSYCRPKQREASIIVKRNNTEE